MNWWNEMNLPNKLTLGRIAVLPLILIAAWAGGRVGWGFAAFLGLLAALTDLADGWIARRTDSETDFGAAMDPIADKALFFTLALPLAHLGAFPWPLVWLFLMRELVMSGLRIAAAGKRGEVIPASYLGKAKTVLQDVGILLLAFAQLFLAAWMSVTGIVFLVLAAILTILSLVEYVLASRDVWRF